jgi:hypothetical protein
MTASHQWRTRPDDERFTSLLEMQSHFSQIQHESRALVISNRGVEVVPMLDNEGLAIQGKAKVPYAPTHWAFGQLAQLAGAPAGYLRDLPSPIAADCLNWGLQKVREIEDVGLLLQQNGSAILRAATGPRYGRIWNSEVVSALISFCQRHQGSGTGTDGLWRVPGEFGKAVEVTTGNTTMYAGDRDMFVFLANESNRIEIPNRRNGQAGSLARGFFVWNSEVGSATLGFATFLFDYVCCNRIVWGAESYQEIRVRHTASAPDRWLEELAPAIQTYGNASTKGVTQLIEDARNHRLDDVDEFLAKRFGKRMIESLKATHMLEESRPIETLWDAVVATTAQARGLANQDSRVELERAAGALLGAPRPTASISDLGL